jgi:hypothetical protein
MTDPVLMEEPGFWRVIKLRQFRKTEGVSFDIMPMEVLPRIDGIDRVVHKRRAISPGAVGEVARPWYIHAHQEDNLLVLHGKRTAEIYNLQHKRVEVFTVTPDYVERNGILVYEGPAMVVWPVNVFHRITTGDEGSASINFAVRHPGFDIHTAFDVYDLDTATGEHHRIREGKLDQFLDG